MDRFYRNNEDQMIDDWLRVSELWTRIPSDSLTCPRDNQPLGKSSDMLFQARLLAHRKLGCSRIAVFREQKRMIYLLCGPKGTILHPMTGLPVEPAADWEKRNILKMGTVAKYFGEFWSFRRMGKHFGSGRASFTLRVDDLILGEDGKINSKAIASAKKRWCGWALDGGEDRICDHVRELNLLDIAAWEPATPHDDVAICPLDGPVRCIVGHYSTPSWTWERGLCGRHWAFALCPKCLGEFATTLVSMS